MNGGGDEKLAAAVDDEGAGVVGDIVSSGGERGEEQWKENEEG